ncbi:MAG TPA: flagellar basal body P-ring formation chaperone FlgA [Candidatus Dormibacteraeota bacterium]|nr:flagellar basal body P-ring formation chaperone FlgA [Candidatus Dormibacteraeota bacterium]
MRWAIAAVLLLAIGMLQPPASAMELQNLAGSRISAFATRIAQAAAAGPDRRIDEVSGVPDLEIPAGSVSLARGALPTPTATYLSVPVVVSVDGRVVRTVYVGYRITTYIAVPVAARALPAGTVLSASDLVMKRLPALGRIPATTDELIGRRTLASVQAGTPVFPEMTALVPLVRAGQPCMLMVTDGGVVLTAEAISRQDGALGQTVAVYVEQTKHAMTAIVSGPGRVELDLSPDGGGDGSAGS